PTFTPTPTATPTTPWLALTPAVLYPAPAAPQTVVLAFGNQTVGDTLRLTLSGPVVFADGAKTQTLTLSESAGSLNLVLRSENGAAAGTAFTLTAATVLGETTWDGIVGYGVYWPWQWQQGIRP
ncbi:MAG: hypothetical protein RMN24_15540, partial [Anaerolineae bacterium]|nr:hypothetical protein [Anaerolineae bacterium]